LAAIQGQTDPVGTLTIPFPAESDTPFSLPLHRPAAASGIHLPFGNGYFYYDGTRGGRAGWYAAGGSEDGPRDDVILPPDRFFLLRNPTGEKIRLLLTGSVHRIEPSILLRTIEERVAREQPIAFAYPVPVSLRQTGLAESPAFAPSGNFFEPEDKLLVYDDPTHGYNPSPDRAYFYFAGSPELEAGWYEVGNPGTGPMDEKIILSAGTGVVLRKSGAP